jgi:hypothetical protein
LLPRRQISSHAGLLSGRHGQLLERGRLVAGARPGEASDPNLPIEPGVREGRDALVRWAVLLEAVIP